MNCENQLILLKFHKFPSFISMTNSRWNGLVGGKLVRPPFLAVCFRPATRERLPNPVLEHSIQDLNGWERSASEHPVELMLLSAALIQANVTYTS